MKISLDKIGHPPFQIREEVDEEHVEEIRESFERDGQWNPIIVRPVSEDSDHE